MADIPSDVAQNLSNVVGISGCECLASIRLRNTSEQPWICVALNWVHERHGVDDRVRGLCFGDDLPKRCATGIVTAVAHDDQDSTLVTATAEVIKTCCDCVE